MINNSFKDYQSRLVDCMRFFDWLPVSKLAKEMLLAYKEGKQVPTYKLFF